MIDHILKMCTSYIVHVSRKKNHFWRVMNLDIFPSEMLTVDFIAKYGCNLFSFLFIWTLHIDCLLIDDTLPRRRSRAEFGLVYLISPEQSVKLVG